MAASSSTGAGLGVAGNLTTRELSMLANGPAIMIAGYVTATELIASPPTTTNYVRFPHPLPGGSDNYVVMLTGIGTGAVDVANMVDDEDGNFSAFFVNTAADGQVMYTVISKGVRPIV